MIWDFWSPFQPFWHFLGPWSPTNSGQNEFLTYLVGKRFINITGINIINPANQLFFSDLKVTIGKKNLSVHGWLEIIRYPNLQSEAPSSRKKVVLTPKLFGRFFATAEEFAEKNSQEKVVIWGRLCWIFHLD